MINVALAGNPNSGKTTLFNALTGSTAHVGNWPGVTVDKREGICRKKDKEEISVVDLPGIYSLAPYTPEEVIARNYVLDEKPDCIINVVDVTNFERNMYLTTQVLEIDIPVVIALNMADTLEKNGMKVDVDALSKKTGVPVVLVSALRGEGLDELVDAVLSVKDKKRQGTCVLDDTALTHLVGDVKIAMEVAGVDYPLFHAVKLIENDELEVKSHGNLTKAVDEFKSKFSDDVFGNDFEAYVADARYKYVCKYYVSVIKGKKQNVVSGSDKIDRVMTNKWVGIPLFILILFTMFHLTFSEDFLYLGAIFSLPTLEELGLMVEGEYVNFGAQLLSCFYDGAVMSPGYVLFYLMDLLTSTLSGWIVAGLESVGAAEWLVGFIGDGILGGLCGVLSFVPQIVFLLLLLSILEDTGYMARVAFILDRIFRRFGVSGRAFIPMIMGFGCSVPAIVNTRTLSDERERTLTIRTIPFFSCGAKLPILVAVAGAVGHMAGLGDGSIISFSMYIIGMLVAVVSILVMRTTTQRGEVSPFIMELPAYHRPSGRNLAAHVWDKTKHYMQKVFTVILASTIVVWFLSNFGWNWQMCDIDKSILASLGQLVQPLFTPLGFGSQLNQYGWVFAVAAVTGLIAKEEVIATFGTLAAIFTAFGGDIAAEGAADVMTMVQGTGIGAAGLVAFIVFNMTTIPCFATVATAKGETPKGKFKWTLLFWVATSYVVTSMTYTILEFPWTIALWVVAATLVAVGIWLFNKKKPIKD